MAEFTQTMSGDSRYSIKLTVTEVIPSDYVTTNKTNVNYTLTATKSGGSGYWNNNANNPVKVFINNDTTPVLNTQIAYDFRNATPKTITLASGTVTGIEHNADGSKTISVKGFFQDAGNSLGQATASGNLTLTTIPRASQPIVYDQNDQIRVSATLGENLKIETFRASSNFKHKLQIKIGNSVVEEFTNVDAEKNPWIPAVSTYAPHISTQSATATIICTTYNGQTELGTKTYNITLTVPKNSTTKPVANISISKGDNVVPTNWRVYVKGKSKLAVTISGTPYHTTIKTYSSTTNGTTNTNSSYTTGELTTVGTNTIKATVTDNRNYTSDEVSQTYTVQDYFTPTLSLTVERCNSSGVISDDGTYIKYSLTGNIASVSSNNEKSFVLKYREKTGSTWTQIFSNRSNYSISADGTQYPVSSSAGVFNIEKEYVFRLEAEDYFYKSANNNTVFIEQEIGTVADIFNFNPNGKSLAIGGVSQRSSSEDAQDVYKTTYFHKNVDFLNPTYFSSYDVHNGFVRGKTIEGGAGTNGYFYVCDITNEGVYPGQFLEFTFMQRNRYGKMILRLSGNGTSGAITGIWAGWIATMSSDIHAYYTLSNNKVSLYVQKSEAYDSMDVLIRKGNYEIGRAKITWVNTTVTSLPSGASEIGGMTLRVSITGGAGSATKATQDNSDLPFISNYAKARNSGATSFDDVSDKLRRSGLYTESIGGTWYNLINVRHRNGESDGTGYGLQIRSAMTTSNIESARLQYRNQYTANGWTGWQTITPDSLRGCAMLKLTSNYNFTATAWADTQVAFSGRSTFTNSNSTLFEQSGNGIKCKFSGWVQVVGAVGSNKTNEFDASILKGSTQIIRAINGTGSQSFATAVFQVATNDVVYLGFASGNTSGTIYNTTHFTITRVS